MKFLRTIRFDSSDDHVFERAAAADEWAIPGGFLFAGSDPENLTGKARQAFANGFVGMASFGHSTLVSVAEIDEVETEDLVRSLAGVFRQRFGAPDDDSATNAAHDEIGFVLDLCADLPINTLLALTRSLDEAGGIREKFRTLEAPTGMPHARIWDVVEEPGDAP